MGIFDLVGEIQKDLLRNWSNSSSKMSRQELKQGIFFFFACKQLVMSSLDL